jgi:hypothetical protein
MYNSVSVFLLAGILMNGTTCRDVRPISHAKVNVSLMSAKVNVFRSEQQTL